jgi:hypothetical protein
LSVNILSPTPCQTRCTSALPTRVLLDATLATHWIAEAFPLPASPTDYQALVQSIVQDRRIIEPIVLYEGQILDGRVREDIAKEHGIPCWAINFENTQDGVDAAGSKEALDRAARNYLLQKNVVRRHYTQGQRAAIAAQLATMPQGARTDLEPSAALRKVSQPNAARLCGVSVRSVQNAERIYREGRPEDVERMLSGIPLQSIINAIAARKKGTTTIFARRADRDFYRTPQECVELAAPLMDNALRWWEPCAGDGAISAWYSSLISFASDIHPLKPEIKKLDALRCDKPDGIDAIITNPPFYAAYALLDRALFEWRIPALMLIRIEPLSTLKRKQYTAHLSHMNIVSNLIAFETADGRIVNGNGTMRCAWCLFSPRTVQFTITHWVAYGEGDKAAKAVTK